MLLIALAAQLSLPTPDVRTVFSFEDMPGYVIAAGINRYIKVRTTVKPDGSLQDCAVEQSGGDKKLDTLTCAIILKRAKLKGASWIDGSPAYAVLRTPVNWTIGDAPSAEKLRNAYPEDIVITVSRLPKGIPEPAVVPLIVAVDENGRVVGCDAAPPERWERRKTFSELVPVACQQMTAKAKLPPARDGTGHPVRSVQSAEATFTAER